MELTKEHYKEFVELFGSRAVDPNVFPATFHYQVKLFLYWKMNNGKDVHNQ